jgi:TolB-like protein/Tfp pilus assembly protein PilF
MPSDASDPKVEIAHILTMDVVEYSTLLITEQSRIMAELKRVVRNTTRFRRAEADGKLICLPTGDGMALVFLDDSEAPIECAMEISSTIKSSIPLRMGIHSGPIHQVLDVNERANVAGAGMDGAQRVMDCGDAGHILLSKRIAEDLTPFPRWNPHLHDLGECEVKHGRKVRLVNFYTDAIGNPKTPKRCVLEGEEPSGGKARSTVVQTNAKSIAVMPFANLSPDPDNAYLAAGIQEEILNLLSKIHDLKVISRRSTQRYQNAPESLPEIARQLGVAHVLEGTIQKSADQVRVHVQLIRAESDAHVWSEKYDRKLTDIFAVESEIANSIAAALQAKLTGAERQAIAAQPTENSEAHQLYLRGLYYWNKFLAPGFEKSGAYFQQAIDLDPGYALAYCGLSVYYSFAAANGLAPPDQVWPKAEAAANKALALDDKLAEAYNPLAAVQLYLYRDWAAAERAFRRGIELNPNFPETHHHYALCLTLFERHEEALSEVKRAAELDPFLPRHNLNWARVLFFMRQYDLAIEQFQKTLELDPNYAMPHEWLAYTYEKKGMHREAIAEWTKALILSDQTEHAAIVERTYSASDFGAAVRALAQKKLELLHQKKGQGEYVPPVDYVLAFTRMGDREQAFSWLAKAVAERTRVPLEIKINPIFDELRDDPRFDQLVKAVVVTM